MEAKEFKEKFKIGDLITCDAWENYAEQLGGTNFAKIVVIGEEEFCIEDEGELIVFPISDRDWQHYKEPVKKDLEGVRSWFLVSKDFSGVRVDVLYSDENYIKYLKTTHINIQEIITIEEAIKRGLKL